MKKIISLFAGVVLSMTLYAGTLNSTSIHESLGHQNVLCNDVKSDVSAMTHDYALNSSEGWSVIEVRGYNSYGQYIHTVSVAMKYTSNGYIYMARMTGLRYDNDEWFSVTKGYWKCGDKTYKFRFNQWESTLYFNLQKIN